MYTMQEIMKALQSKWKQIYDVINALVECSSCGLNVFEMMVNTQDSSLALEIDKFIPLINSHNILRPTFLRD